ncbi:hypothetical protein KAJ27_14115 [bacterium]|nr:hypothetical protein [bacterium]
MDNPYCSCNSDEMDPDCPVMQEKSQGLLLIFPAAPLERNSGKTIQKQILYQSIQFGHAEIGSGNNSEYYSGIPVNAPPIKQITELYKIVETFLI